MGSDSSRAIRVTVQAGAWERVITEPNAFCERVIGATLTAYASPLPAQTEVSVLLTDDAHVRELNRDWRGKDQPTNVLSFPATDGPVVMESEVPLLLGDVVLAFETSCREAEVESKPVTDHVAH